MKKLTILHTADLHLDSPFEGLDAGKAAMRRGEQRELLGRLAALVQREGVQLVLLAGDLLDSDKPYFETGEELALCLGRMGVPVFIAPGNHDFYSPKSPWARLKLPENVHVFSDSAMQGVTLESLGVTVWGAAFTSPRSAGKLCSFRAPAEGMQLMLLHADVGGNMGYGPIGEEEIAASGLRYLALGHVHACSGLRRSGDTFWAYPGCLMGRGFDETGEKGYLTLELDEEDCRAEVHPLPSRR